MKCVPTIAAAAKKLDATKTRKGQLEPIWKADLRNATCAYEIIQEMDLR